MECWRKSPKRHTRRERRWRNSTAGPGEISEALGIATITRRSFAMIGKAYAAIGDLEHITGHATRPAKPGARAPRLGKLGRLSGCRASDDQNHAAAVGAGWRPAAASPGCCEVAANHSRRDLLAALSGQLQRSLLPLPNSMKILQAAMSTSSTRMLVSSDTRTAV